ncbi:MAG: antA/AntB antirepressor family protein [Bacteroidetes bacterium]|nr:antA/AntB antirepressor family protein [Bacteroidota bacterium]
MVLHETNKKSAKHSSSDFAISSRNELPLITSNNELLVDARLLHEKLKSRQQFSNWINNRIKDYDFLEGKDFLINLFNRAGRGIGRGKMEYHLTLDMAKEICMVERSEIGRAFRRYFIEAEKELRTRRLYAASSTITEVSKTVKPYQLNGRKMFELRKVRAALGFSPKSNTSGIKKHYAGLIILWDNRLYVSEEYVRVLMSRAKTRALHEEARAAKPVLPENFGMEVKHGK